jgi:hypothetical protein
MNEAERLLAISRLDSELAAMAQATSPPGDSSPSASTRIAWLGAGIFGGFAFGGAVAGPVGVPYCTLLGAIAGGYRAVTGRPILEVLSESATAPLPGSQRAIPAVQPMGWQNPPMAATTSPCESQGTKHCAG